MIRYETAPFIVPVTSLMRNFLFLVAVGGKLEVVPRVKKYPCLLVGSHFCKTKKKKKKKKRQILSSIALHCIFFLRNCEEWGKGWEMYSFDCMMPSLTRQGRAWRLLGERCQTLTIWHALYPDLTAPLHTLTGFPH